MPRPEFTPIERYLIEAVRVGKVSGQLHFEIGYLVPAGAFAVIGFYHNSGLPIIVAFAVILFFRGWDLLNNRKYAPCWRSIIEKYEAAIDGAIEEATTGRPGRGKGVTPRPAGVAEDREV